MGFLTQQYVLSHIDLYLKPRKEVPGIPYHGLNILKSIPHPEKKLVNSPKVNHNQKALYHQNLNTLKFHKSIPFLFN